MRKIKKIKIAIIGLGNCASSLIQGIYYYKEKTPDNVIGLMHWSIGSYKPSDIKVVAAIDIDKRKVGKDVSEAIFSKPNCTTTFYRNIPKMGVKVVKGRVLDSIAPHMNDNSRDQTFILSNKKEEDIIN